MLSVRIPQMMYSQVLDFMAVPGYAQGIYPSVKDAAFRFMVKPKCPPEVLYAIEQGYVFVAHNARFEQAIWFWICHRLWGWPMPKRWSCTAARARYWGIRASLDGATSDLEVVNRKNPSGKEFINDFCKPRKYKGAKKLGIVQHLWYEPWEQPEKWAAGLQYCGDDTLAEMDVDELLPDLPPFEQALWELDFKMNTRGFPIDVQSVERAREFSAYFTQMNFERFEQITALRPTQRDKVLEYIAQREDIDTLGDLKSKTLRRIVLDDLPADLRDVISIRLETSKASIKKLDTISLCTDADGFARGTQLFYGAGTGRWSAKRIQTHNFTRPNMEVLKAMFQYLSGEFWNSGMVGHNGGPPLDEMPQQPAWVFEAGLRFARPLAALAVSMRGFIAAPKGKKIVSGDYAQIEVRVLNWFARCMYVLEAFGNGDDVYTRFGAEHMYGKRYEDCIFLKDGKPKVQPWFDGYRQKAKSAFLGCGFQVSGKGFQEYCDNIDLIISLDEANEIVKKYRNAHPEISHWEAGLWARMERAAIMAVHNEGNHVQLNGTGITFHIHRIDVERYWLLMTLPSGRHIAYYRPKVRLGERFGRTVEKLSYRREWNGKSYREDTYGGKLTENAVQGTARDVMGCGALNVENAGFPVHGLVHDEIITLTDEEFGGPEAHRELCAHMCNLPPWITDLPVAAEGGTMYRYGK